MLPLSCVNPEEKSAPPHPSPSRARLFAGLRLLPVAAILVYGALLRLDLPLAPFADPDTWGYLGPTVEHSLGHGFPQIYGRAFIYPLFLRAVLAGFGDFSAITVVQHILGLLAGVVLWSAWTQLAAALPAGRVLRWLHYILGLVALTWLLANNTTILYEHRLRPEALFPLISAVTVWLAIRSFTLPADSRAFTLTGALLCAAHGFFYVLHPVFGLATVFSSLPVIVRALRARTTWWRRLVVPVALPLALLALQGTERLVYTSRDAVAPIFGAMTCFAFQADAVVHALDRDLAAPSPPFPADLVRTASRLIHAELDRVAASGQSQGTLSYDADRLLYHPEAVCMAVRRYYHDEPRPIAAFFFHYYRQGVTARPSLYLAKISRNLALVFAPPSKLLATVPEQLDPAAELKLSHASLTQPYPLVLGFPAGAAYDRAFDVHPTEPSTLNDPGLQLTIALAGFAYPIVLSAALLVAASLALTARWQHAARFASLRLLGLITFLVFGYNLFLCLTVALLSSLDNSRYAENQSTFTLFAFFTAVLFLSVTCLTLLPARVRGWLRVA